VPKRKLKEVNLHTSGNEDKRNVRYRKTKTRRRIALSIVSIGSLDVIQYGKCVFEIVITYSSISVISFLL